MKLYKVIVREIHSDVCKENGTEEVMAELTSIYNKMVYYE